MGQFWSSRVGAVLRAAESARERPASERSGKRNAWPLGETYGSERPANGPRARSAEAKRLAPWPLGLLAKDLRTNGPRANGPRANVPASETLGLLAKDSERTAREWPAPPARDQTFRERAPASETLGLLAKHMGTNGPRTVRERPASNVPRSETLGPLASWPLGEKSENERPASERSASERSGKRNAWPLGEIFGNERRYCGAFAVNEHHGVRFATGSTTSSVAPAAAQSRPASTAPNRCHGRWTARSSRTGRSCCSSA